jgi:carbonic anhydrase/acetyltransferase-like protein (isoleucine patch superfamily)
VIGVTFIHPKAEVDSKAKLGKNVYVSAFAAINANEGEIEIGDNTSIQECCVLHGERVRIGKNVTVGHGAIIHGASIGDNVLIGMNSTILDNAEVGDWCIIGAGAVVTGGAKIPEGSVVLGVPGKVVRKINEEDRKLIRESAGGYLRKQELL